MVTSNKNGKKKESLMAKSLQGGDSVTYVSRPRRKPDVTTKGKLNEWSNGFKEFIPQGQKASNRNMLKQLGNPSWMILASMRAESATPADVRTSTSSTKRIFFKIVVT